MSDEENKIYVGQTLDFLFEVRDGSGEILDVSAATSKKLYLRRIGLNKKEFDLSVVGSGVDGQVHYTASGTDLDIPGKWMAQYIITDESGNVYPSQIKYFTVHARG